MSFVSDAMGNTASGTQVQRIGTVPQTHALGVGKPGGRSNSHHLGCVHIARMRDLALAGQLLGGIACLGQVGPLLRRFRTLRLHRFR
jgi:hypothetical protein